MRLPRIQTDSENFDIDAREAQVIGTGQRIAPMAPIEFTDEAKQLADSVRSLFGVTDLSGIPDIFATMFKHPSPFYACYMVRRCKLRALSGVLTVTRLV
jgi:hypothetical protein